MKRTPKPVFFIVALLIVALAYTSFFGIYKNFGDREDTIIRGASDIRTGIDINGGIEVTFAPEDESIEATDAQIEAMKEVIVRRMIANNITDYEAYTDSDNNQVIIRFPWKNNETEFDAKSAIEELGKTALLEFYIDETESTGLPTEKPEKADFVLNGSLVSSATPGFDQDNVPVVSLELDSAGKEAFSKATQKQADLNKGLTTKKCTISIWLDDECISNPTVNEHISDGNAQISGGFADYARLTWDFLPRMFTERTSGLPSAILGAVLLLAIVLGIHVDPRELVDSFSGAIVYAVLALLVTGIFVFPGERVTRIALGGLRSFAASVTALLLVVLLFAAMLAAFGAVVFLIRTLFGLDAPRRDREY